MPTARPASLHRPAGATGIMVIPMAMGLLGLRDLGPLTLCLASVRAILVMATSPSSIHVGSIHRPGTRAP